MMLVYGLLTGIAMGFLFQKARVIRYDKQVGALRLTDMTVVKFLLTTVLVGAVGFHLLYDFGLVAHRLKATMLGGNILGGLVFGVGWGLLGYCPGTAAGALGEGRWDALWGILGMLVGAAVFAEAYPFLKRTVLTWGVYGELTLPEVFGVDHWLVIAVLALGAALLFKQFLQKEL